MSVVVNLPLSVITLAVESRHHMLGFVTNAVSIAVALLVHLAILLWFRGNASADRRRPTPSSASRPDGETA